MHPRLRLWLILALGATAGVVVAFDVAQESYALAGLLVVLIGWLLLEWMGGPRPEAWVLAAALVGYILGNRGFAQLLLTPNLPLLPAEGALLAGVTATVLRMALRQTAGLVRDSLNVAVLVWILLGAARLWPDVRTHGMLALRDFATVYYALFFFIAQSLARHAPSARLLRQALLTAFVALPFTYFIFGRFTDFFLGTVQLRGVPLIYYKDDLVAANLFAGFFLLMTVPTWPLLARGGVALIAYASAFAINSSRAAIMGLLVASAWWAVARRWAPWKLQALAVPLALGLLALLAVVQERDIQQSRLYTLYEHVASMVDFTGTGRYTTDDHRYVGDNNRFRLSWWRSVVEETRDGGPVFGLGFGYDLTSRFLRNYEFDLGDEFTTRSPHSILLTVLGRMGLAGFIAWIAIIATMALRTLRLARLARTDATALAPLGLWSVSWVMLISGCLGVVLEGPMGAIVFWSALGLANASSTDVLAAARDHVSGTRADAADLPSATPAVEVTTAP